MKEQRGISLVEIIVVIAILMVLMGVLWLVVGPKAKERAIQTRITSDLRQIVVAINIYMADNEGRYPRGFSDLPSTTPQKYENWPLHGYASRGTGHYFFTYSPRTRERLGRYPFQVKFDPDKHPIVGAGFFQPREPFVEKCMKRMPGVEERTMIDCPFHWEMSGFLDGSVRWTKQRDEWRREAAYWNMKP